MTWMMEWVIGGVARMEQEKTGGKSIGWWYSRGCRSGKW